MHFEHVPAVESRPNPEEQLMHFPEVWSHVLHVDEQAAQIVVPSLQVPTVH